MINLSMFTRKSRSVDMTPMIDMVFLLLIFFLLTSVFAVPSINSDLPASSTEQKTDKLDSVVTLKADGRILVGEAEILPQELENRLKSIVAESGGKVITLAADREVNFESIVTVMDSAVRVGAVSVEFLTESKDE
ncbi:biopolymer transporter ExbD [Geovibrio thiophilus]|uniref:Biopolymer transporter ExbD n=1 Tax=Geovibrio thiophilus TaxID=139438 RepID=A0A410JZ74_9BACT|nr:biopolymer transporter ExbD [Geovibrio thiophilus]QAR33429.1 biopolymer transporter ExbD [Geovibrio thiophilus]